MSNVPTMAATAVGLFAGTNVDDMIVLALLFAASRAGGRPRRWEIWAGQYAGIAALVGLSLAASRGLVLIPGQWLWLLALVPFTLGAWKLATTIRAARRGDRPAPPSVGGLAGVAALTVSNGGDNLAAYTPFFATSTLADVTVTVAVFAVGVALWCLAGSWLTRHKRVTAIVERYGHWLLPAVLFLIACYILFKTRAPFLQ